MAAVITPMYRHCYYTYHKQKFELKSHTCLYQPYSGRIRNRRMTTAEWKIIKLYNYVHMIGIQKVLV